MPDVIFTGPDGRLEGRYHPARESAAPIALVLHAHPKGGGSMEDPVVTGLFDLFKQRDFAVLRFNFRGVGRSQGEYDQGAGELSDAAAALDWVQTFNTSAPFCWVAGYSFGAWIGMQLLMRRPEVRGFISVAPPMNTYDFSFLAPCPAAGLVINGTRDQVAPPDEISRVVSKIRTQKDITVTHETIEGANHFFLEHLDPLMERSAAYLDLRLEALRATAG
ncbi:MAG: alpha/beta hydrolase [Caulobacterales bacterium]|nr:alpha/beta hydrolase [Caulobacterales bacterium]